MKHLRLSSVLALSADLLLAVLALLSLLAGNLGLLVESSLHKKDDFANQKAVVYERVAGGTWARTS